MYLSSWIHREILFEMVSRWFCNRLQPDDGLNLTQNLICDGYVLTETLNSATRLLLESIHDPPFAMKPIRFKGELRDMLCEDERGETARVKELLQSYRADPDFYYREAPMNGVACLDDRCRLLGIYRVKRPRRIAEKANRYVANWIFRTVQDKAHDLAEERAKNIGVPLKYLLTPETEMAREFIDAERMIAEAFRQGEILLDRTAMTINDVGGIKVVADEDQLSRLEGRLAQHPFIKVLCQESYQGNYQAKSLILEMPWDRDRVCHSFKASRAWERYVDRGIGRNILRRGIEPFLEGAQPSLRFELILSTFPAMVESEMGASLHEARIIVGVNAVFHCVEEGLIAGHHSLLKKKEEVRSNTHVGDQAFFKGIQYMVVLVQAGERV